jgi:putative oxidoreductase
MKSIFTRLRQLYDRFFDLVAYLQSPFLLIVRLYWGCQLAESGWGKLHNIDKVTEFFTSLRARFIFCSWYDCIGVGN